jgi:HEAT repeats
VNNAPLAELAPPPSYVEDLLQVLVKGLRATQLYLPNNPVYQRAVENIRAGFRKIWQATDILNLDVEETALRWEERVVYSQDQRADSVAWTLYKDGIRSISLRPGVEDTEIVRFLAVLHKSKNITSDAADDLLTLLWAEDFEFLSYTFRELAIENAMPIEGGGGIPGLPAGEIITQVQGDVRGEGSAGDVRTAVQEEAPSRREGVVSIEDFDTTLYFLEDREIEYLRKEVEREYGQDLRRNVLAMLFDLLELQAYGTVRAELIGIVENFIPYLLGAADFRSVAYILRQTRVVLERARELIPEQRAILLGIPGRLSQPEPLAQLLQSLDEATVHPTEEELAEAFTEMRAEALPTLMGWIPRLTSERVKWLVNASAARLAQDHPPEVLKVLAGADAGAQLEMVRLAGRLKLAGAVDAMGPLLETGDLTLKLAVVEALLQVATPTAFRMLEKGVDDPDRDVRIAAVKFLASRGHRNALARVEAALETPQLKTADLTEKMAFYEAYGTLAGPKGVAALRKVLVTKGMFSRKEDPETRACAAMALGKMRSPEARAALDAALEDKEPLVRNAVTRALREVGA